MRPVLQCKLCVQSRKQVARVLLSGGKLSCSELGSGDGRTRTCRIVGSPVLCTAQYQTLSHPQKCGPLLRVTLRNMVQ